jgi:hypothetical protein
MQEERAGSRETIPSSLVLSYFIFLLLFKQIYIYIYIHDKIVYQTLHS